MNFNLTVLIKDDSRLEELKTQLPSPESSQFKLCAIDFEKVRKLVLFYHAVPVCVTVSSVFKRMMTPTSTWTSL